MEELYLRLALTRIWSSLFHYLIRLDATSAGASLPPTVDNGKLTSLIKYIYEDFSKGEIDVIADNEQLAMALGHASCLDFLGLPLTGCVTSVIEIDLSLGVRVWFLFLLLWGIVVEMF